MYKFPSDGGKPEKLPIPDAEKEQKYTGWGWGWKVIIGPEWSLASGRWGVGAEVAMARGGFKLTHEYRSRELALARVTTRGYVKLYL